jgi:hypothetical protein
MERPVNEEALGRIPTTSDQIHPFTGAGSVTAADRSTISWTTAADGTITATGSDGREMTISGVPGSVAGAGVAFAFANKPAAPYLTLSRTVSPNAVKVAAAAGTDSLTVTVTVSGTGSGTAEVSGEHAGVPFQWSGPVNLAGNPRAELAAVRGYDPDAFTAPLEQAAYFGPACQALVNQPSATPTQTERKAVALDATSSSVGSFGIQAEAWGLGSVCGTIAVAASGPTLGGSALIGVFACGAGAFALAEAADYLTNGDLSDLAAPIDVNALIEQIQNQQQVGPGLLPPPVETVTGPGGEQVGPPDDSDGGGGGSGEGPDDKPGLQPD